MDPSPPPFIVFRTKQVQRVDLYQLALDFTALVEAIVQKTDVRFHMKDRLDRAATAIAMWVGQAADDPVPSARRMTYSKARKQLADCSTLLDILARRPTIDRAVIEPAQHLCAQLLAKLEHLS